MSTHDSDNPIKRRFIVSDLVQEANGYFAHGQYARWRKALLTAHIVAAISLVGADLMLVGLGISGLRGAQALTVSVTMAIISWGSGWIDQANPVVDFRGLRPTDEWRHASERQQRYQIEIGPADRLC